MVPETLTVSNVFGSRVYEQYRSDLTLMEATPRNDEEENRFRGLVKEGTAALLNSYAREGFPYRPWQVNSHCRTLPFHGVRKLPPKHPCHGCPKAPCH